MSIRNQAKMDGSGWVSEIELIKVKSTALTTTTALINFSVCRLQTVPFTNVVKRYYLH